jgi:biopolymer transport protein ExbD
MAFRQDQDEAITQINVVPLVDIMLVLLIIFMLTASFISNPSIPVHVPKAYTASPTAPASQSLVLSAQGDLYYRDQPITRDDLLKALKLDLSIHPDLKVVLSADGSTPHGQVVDILDLIRQAGVTQIALGVTRP